MSQATSMTNVVDPLYCLNILEESKHQESIEDVGRLEEYIEAGFAHQYVAELFGRVSKAGLSGLDEISFKRESLPVDKKQTEPLHINEYFESATVDEPSNEQVSNTLSEDKPAAPEPTIAPASIAYQ